METTTQLVTEFITHTGANTQDAVSCLKSWEWDLKKALIDYNGIYAFIAHSTVFILGFILVYQCS